VAINNNREDNYSFLAYLDMLGLASGRASGQ